MIWRWFAQNSSTKPSDSGNYSIGLSLVLALCAVGLTGCLPSFLQKYQQDNRPVEVVESRGPPALPLPVTRRPAASSMPQPKHRQVSMQRLSDQHYRSSRPLQVVWQAALKVLMNHYNINIIDRDSGVITTEWDSFYLNRGVFRNKVSLLVMQSEGGQVDVKLYNNVETLSQRRGGVVWLPSDNDYNETKRIADEIDKAIQTNWSRENSP